MIHYAPLQKDASRHYTTVQSILFLGLLLLLCSAYAHAELTIENAYVRAPIPGTSNTSAYFTLRNTDKQGIVVTQVDSPVAKKTLLHGYTRNGEGMIRMEKVSSITVPAGKTVTLKPSGYHVMLLDVNREALLRDKTLTLEVTWKYTNGTAYHVTAVTAPVQSPKKVIYDTEDKMANLKKPTH